MPDRITIVVEDEGEGFDWRSLPDPTDPENLLLAHGRGVLLANLSVDELTFNEAGNRVTLVAHVKPQA
jgi:anti-sigma regulatory factor (Ser/Thr protein kinase)